MKKIALMAMGIFMAASICTQAADVAKNPKIRMETTKGAIIIELYPQAAPKTVANILQYVKDGFYNGTIFHRVIKGFMIQGGGFTPDMAEKATRPPVVNEADNGLKNEIGTLAMARTSDPHSATAQFFINTKKNDFLNFTSKDSQGWGYCVFGKVVGGMVAVTAIEGVTTTSKGMNQDVPETPVVITKVSVIEDKPESPKAATAAVADSTVKKAK